MSHVLLFCDSLSSLSLLNLACCTGFCNCHHDGWSLFDQWLQSLLGNKTNIVGSMSRTRRLMIDDDSQKRSHQYQDTRTKNYWDLRQTDRVRVGICWFSFPWLVAWQFQNVSELYWLAGQYRSLCEHKVDTTCVKCAEQGNNRKERNKWISSAGICSHEWDSKSLAAKRKGQKWVAACSYTSWQARRNHGTSMLLNLAWDDTAGAMRNDAINNIQK